MTRSRLLIFGMIIVVIGVLAWFALERRGESQVSADKHAPNASVEVDAAGLPELAERQKSAQAQPLTEPKSAVDSKVPASPLTPNELPEFDTPPDQALARLLVLADAGNSNAQIDLSGRLADCTARALRATRQRDESDRRSIEKDRANQKMDEDMRTMRIENTQNRLDQHAAERAACDALPAEVLEGWLDPIDQAAQSGSIYAMRQYAALVVAEYDTRDAVVADVDRAIVRRDKARAYLNKAVSLGEAEALADLAYAYFNMQDSHPQLYAVDHYQAYVYAYAGSFGERGQYRKLDWVMADSAESLDSRQITDARKQGKRLYDACCLNH